MMIMACDMKLYVLPELHWGPSQGPKVVQSELINTKTIESQREMLTRMMPAKLFALTAKQTGNTKNCQRFPCFWPRELLI